MSDLDPAIAKDRALAVALDAWLEHVRPASWTERQLLTAGFLAGWGLAKTVAYEEALEQMRKTLAEI